MTECGRSSSKGTKLAAEGRDGIPAAGCERYAVAAASSHHCPGSSHRHRARLMQCIPAAFTSRAHLHAISRQPAVQQQETHFPSLHPGGVSPPLPSPLRPITCPPCHQVTIHFRPARSSFSPTGEHGGGRRPWGACARSADAVQGAIADVQWAGMGRTSCCGERW